MRVLTPLYPLILEPAVPIAPKCGHNRGSKEKQRDWERLRLRQLAREDEDLAFERQTLERELARLEDSNQLGNVKAGNKVKEKEKLLVQLEEVKYEIEILTQAIHEARCDGKNSKAEVDKARAHLGTLKAETDAFATRPVKVTLVPAPPKTEIDLLTDKRTAAERRRGQLELELSKIEEQIDDCLVQKADLDFDFGRHRLEVSKLQLDKEPQLMQLHKLSKVKAWRETIEKPKANELAAFERMLLEIKLTRHKLAGHPVKIKELVDQVGSLRDKISSGKQDMIRVLDDYAPEAVYIDDLSKMGQSDFDQLRMAIGITIVDVEALEQSRRVLEDDWTIEMGERKSCRYKTDKAVAEYEKVDAKCKAVRDEIARLEERPHPPEPDPELIKQANNAQDQLRQLEVDLGKAHAQVGGMKIEHTYLSKQITPNLAVDLVQAQKHVKELESQLSIPVATNPSDLVDANKAGVVKSIVGAAREGLEKWRVDATALQERVHPAGGQISATRQGSRASTAASSVGEADYVATIRAQASALSDTIKALQAVVDEYTSEVSAKKQRNTELLLKSVGYKAPVWA